MRFSLLIGDFIRWLFGLVVMYFAISYFFVGLFYLFEYLVWNLNDFHWFYYIIFFSIAYSIVVPLFKGFVSVLLKLTTYVVRQDDYFALIVSGLLFLGIISVLITFWTGYLGFSWEAYNYKTLNQVIFSLYLLSMLGIPVTVIGSLEN